MPAPALPEKTYRQLPVTPKHQRPANLLLSDLQRDRVALLGFCWRPSPQLGQIAAGWLLETPVKPRLPCLCISFARRNNNVKAEKRRVNKKTMRGAEIGASIKVLPAHPLPARPYGHPLPNSLVNVYNQPPTEFNMSVSSRQGPLIALV